MHDLGYLGASRNHFQGESYWIALAPKSFKKRGLPTSFVENNDDVEKALLSSSIVNLKKSSGAKSSSQKDLMKYVDEDWGLIS
ncbi:hypothetical protein [Agaribacterium sp. ZY112]|uniref:hypothetical protein n=1 Tax=Agaribacterium sp. ZY112 TaxID=3233574 RepID=UPI0035261CCC